MECFLCKKHFSPLTVLFCHYRNYHGLASSGSEIKCTIDSCPRVFLSFCKLKKHYEIQHSASLHAYINSNETEIDETDVSKPNESLPMDVDEDDETSASDKIPVTKDSMEMSVMKFMTEITAKANITLANSQLVMENVTGLLTDVATFASQTIKHLAVQLNVPVNDENIRDAISNVQNIHSFVSKADTVYKRDKWLLEHNFLIEANEITLGTREEQRYSAPLKSTRSVLVEDKCYIVPIDLLLAKILEQASSQLIFPQCNPNLLPKRVRDFTDTRTFHNHPFLQKHPKTFLLHFFVDAFEVTNVLGSHTSVHKLEVLYMMIMNVSPEYRSKTDNIFLVGLWYAMDAHVNRYSYYPILQNVVSLLQQLESEQGVVVKVNGKEEIIHAILILFSADNLGAHSLFGFMESFNATYFCRYCKCTQMEIQTTHRLAFFERRTRAEYDLCVSECRNSNYNSSESGIKHGCPLNCLTWFHCIDQSAVDCMHDCLEGCIPLEICLVLQSLIDKKYFSLTDVNNAISHYNYSLADKNSKPPEINLNNIRVQAAESWCLIRNLPLMIGKYIPEDEPHWRLLLLLLDCLDVIFAPEITAGLISQLEFNLEEHHSHFKSIYPEKRLIPKHHFMLHYPEFMTKFGPLSKYWCMRFEAKHRFAKELASVVRNFKNICKTIMRRSQLKLANILFSKMLYADCEQLGTCDTEIVGNLHLAISNSLCAVLNVHQNDEIYIARSVKFGCYEIKPGCMLCCGIVESLPQFGELKCIVSVAKKTYFVCYPFDTLYYHEHFHSYVVKKCDHPIKMIVIRTKELKDYHPYNVISIAGEDGTLTKLVNLRYKIF